MTERFTLGQRVTISGTARKVKERRGYSRAEITYAEAGLPTRHNYPTPKTYTEGIIVGKRTVMDGRAEWNDGAMYTPTVGTARNVWLVAFDMRMNPVMCLDHQVESVTDE